MLNPEPIQFSSSAESLDTPEKRQTALAMFIMQAGGSINFEQFMAHSLYSPGGFYDKRVEIKPLAEGGHFRTYAMNRLFAFLLYERIQVKQESTPGYKFVEIAGGMGVLKENIFRFARARGVSLPYLSIDISTKLSRLQQKHGDENVQGSALRLPLASESITGTIFANELVDALPFRVCRVIKKSEAYPKYDVLNGLEEFYLTVHGQKIVGEWLPASQEAEEYWRSQLEYLLERGFSPELSLKNGQIITMNLYEKQLIEELCRVLARGEIILPDYGDHLDNLLAGETCRTVPREYPAKQSRPLEHMHENVYTTDITANVNFSMLVMTAKSLGLQVKVMPQAIFFAQQFRQETLQRLEVDGEYKELLKEYGNDGGLNPLRKSSWKVLVISK